MCTRPPITIVGSKPAVLNTAAIIDVVVVLPWLPATATPYFMRISSAEHLSARNHRDMAPPRFEHFRIGVFNRGGNHYHRRIAGKIVFLVADKNPRAELAQAARRIAFMKIRAGHRVSRIQQHFGDTAHADAADADEMNFMLFLQHEISVTVKILGMRQTVTLVDDVRRGIGPPEHPSRRRHLVEPTAIGQIATDRSRQNLLRSIPDPKSSRRRRARAAPGRCRADDRKSRKDTAPDIAALPKAVSSATVVAPARHNTKSACAYASSILSINGVTSAANGNPS